MYRLILLISWSSILILLIGLHPFPFSTDPTTSILYVDSPSLLLDELWPLSSSFYFLSLVVFFTASAAFGKVIVLFTRQAFLPPSRTLHSSNLHGEILLHSCNTSFVPSLRYTAVETLFISLRFRTFSFRCLSILHACWSATSCALAKSNASVNVCCLLSIVVFWFSSIFLSRSLEVVSPYVAILPEIGMFVLLTNLVQ